ncbi:hypothetical protein VTK56DRAFT_6572 [Thermocarpiscus australiensis]
MATEASAAAAAAPAAPKKFEWLVVIPDFPNTRDKRIAVREQHFAGLGPSLDSGMYQMGGAILNEVPAGEDHTTFSWAGSTIVVVASSREEILAHLRKDVYATAGVWDLDNAQIWPFLCAFRFPSKK